MSYHSVEIVERASDGTLLPVASLDVTQSYDGDKLEYKEVVFNGVTYRKSFIYSGDKLVSESRWVRQPAS